MSDRPQLWHIGISHYSEKARWALDFKGVAHDRHTPVPGAHIPYVLWLTRGRGYTLPMLELDGRRYAESTKIIAALEERYPEPALYPADSSERQWALELEEFFDEEVGPYARRFAFHEMRKDPRWPELVQRIAPASPLSRFKRMGAAYGRGFTGARYGAGSERRAETAREKLMLGFDYLERELGSNDYLVADRFTVADLTAAALLYPVVLPAEGPFHLEELPEGWRRLRKTVEGRPGFRWVEKMFARHRTSSPASRQSSPLAA